ncbi:uncharacterized protein K452DRAFT_287318 [Aplosporella prunicola CBS 121167]|uniref:Uncharacterized protein n=1 Tax=Aplosporella prunicola CBS 121167 TaxID=1176127 RepID=A0A6A6BD53_9PEZI|nr:uncharacterized protein K452DRAFT_287318 [Aplosporella prunicola CBS 121167]KAF2142109.1 hypothetical protein K452DRAFT_287318 [Aplosporella prunicola CBS 121167]
MTASLRCVSRIGRLDKESMPKPKSSVHDGCAGGRSYYGERKWLRVGFSGMRVGGGQHGDLVAGEK